MIEFSEYEPWQRFKSGEAALKPTLSVLVSTRSAALRDSLRQHLSACGFSVSETSVSDDIPSTVRSLRPQAVLLETPVSDGIEICRTIKSDPDTKQCSLLVITTGADIQSKLKYFENGADDCIDDSITPQEIVQRLRRLLHLRSSVHSARFADSADSTIQPKQKYGPYVIDDLVGKGGMGYVFKAHDQFLERPVAIKILQKKRSESGEFVERFRREAKTLASVDHPGIASIYAFGEEGEELYFAMQWCSRGSVADRIAIEGLIDPVKATEWVLQCSGALAAASRKGVVHRDIKPGNLMFDDEDQIKVVDFGLAHSDNTPAHITQAFTIIGTPSYMSPEQAQAGHVDHRSDIFSLGISLYQMIFGSLPFEGRTSLEVLMKISGAPMPELQTRDSKLKEAYEIICKMTKKVPGNRYQDYSALINDLSSLRAKLISEQATFVPENAIKSDQGERNYDRYELLESIGTDSRGRSYKAHDSHAKTTAAVKVLPEEFRLQDGLVESVVERIVKLSSMKHSGFVSIYDHFPRMGEYWIAMEWCSGGSLAKTVRKKGRMQLRQAYEIILHCVKALSSAAKLGLYHGNLNPNNILLTEANEIKIGDMGWSSIQSAGNGDAKIAALLGTPSFMPPEGSDGANERSDIYSLGMIFYYLLYGIAPFGTSLPPYIKTSGTVSTVVYRLIEKMTEPEPENRFTDYESLIRELQSLPIDRPVLEAPRIPKATVPDPVPSIRGTDYFEILAKIYRRGHSGILKTEWVNVQHSFLVRNREIVFFESNQPNKDFWNTLNQQGLIDKSRFHDLNASFEETLSNVVEMNLMSPQTLADYYNSLMKQTLNEVFFWPNHSVEFTPASIESGQFVSIRLADVLLDASRSYLDFSFIRSKLPGNQLVNKTIHFEQLVSSLNLTTTEHSVAYGAQEDKTVSELIRTLNIEENVVYRTLYLLIMIGAIEQRPVIESPVALQDPRPKTVTEPTPDPVPLSAEPAPDAVPEKSVKSTSQERLSEMWYEMMKKKLVSEPADKKSGPDRVEMAHARTGNSRPAPLEAPKQPPIKETKPLAPVETAEKWFALAEEEFEMGSGWKAIQSCNEALKHHDHAKYHHLMGQCYAEHPRFQKEAEEAFHAAIKLSSFNADYHMDLAEFYFNVKLYLRSRTHAEKAYQITRNSERATTLLNALKDMKLGKGNCWCAHSLR